MEEDILISGRDTLLIAIPFVLLLIFTVFRLDESIAAPKGSLNRRRPSCGVDEFGEPILRDPDGRLSGPEKSKCSAGQMRTPATHITIPGN